VRWQGGILSTMNNRPPYDLLILGGGVIGLSCAWQLARRWPSKRIGVIDAPQLGRSASMAAAGMLAPFAEFSKDTPLARLAVASLDLFPQFLHELKADAPQAPAIRGGGTISPRVDLTDDNALMLRAELVNAMGRPVRTVCEVELSKLCPGLSPDIHWALHFPQEGSIDPRRLHAALQIASERRGIERIVGEAVALDRDDDEQRLDVLIDDRTWTLRADQILVATGAWTENVAALVGRFLSMTPIKGQVARLEAPDGWLPLTIHHRSVYLAPRDGQGVLVGATMEDRGFDWTVQGKVIGQLIETAARILPAIRSLPVVESWAGLRPCPPDGVPMIGQFKPPFDTRCWVASGHFRNGILLTPLTGALIARSFAQCWGEVPEPIVGADIVATLSAQTIAALDPNRPSLA